jgi:hypothetical protein
MSWTLVSDLPFTSFASKRAVDATNFHNDGHMLGSVSPQDQHVVFTTDEDQLEIRVKDESLQRFTGLYVEALVNPAGTGTQRMNLIEGLMSFAFVIEKDGRLSGTVFDGEKWVQVTSGTTRVPAGTWSRVSFLYDGIYIGRLTIDDATVGSSVEMPLGMRQPTEVIAVGHWPKGDGRYTFKGEFGHVRIARRDYEDVARDAWRMLLCRRHLTPRQIDALRELTVLMNSLDAATQEEVRACLAKQTQQMISVVRSMSAGDPQGIAAQRQLVERLHDAWCCDFDVQGAKQIFREYLTQQAGAPGSAQRASFLSAWTQLTKTSAACMRAGPPFDRMRELLCITFPELNYVQSEADQLVSML